jgi:LysR family transcriptional regulator, cell division regulator
MNINIYPNPWDLRYFQEIAQTGNLSRAAERLGVGQPALSLSLQRLEESLRVELFVRRHRGLILTEAGQRLLRESNRLLEVWSSVVAETQKTQTELSGRFKIGCHPSVAIYALKDVIKEIYVSFPGIELELVHQLSRIVCENVISGAIDFGLVVNPIKHPDLLIHRLATDEVCFWKTSKGLDDVLIYNPALLQSQALLAKLKKKKIFKRTIISENLEVIATLAGAGAGVALLPSRVASALSTELKQLNGYPTFSDEITFIHRVDLPKTASTKVIKDQFKALRM